MSPRRHPAPPLTPPPGLELPGSVYIGADADQLYDDLAAALMAAALVAVEQRGVFHLALSGGKTPEPFFIRLVIDPLYRALPWKDTHVWMVDERWVAADDPRSNFRMIRETLLNHVAVRMRHVHPIQMTAEDPAGAYEAELRGEFQQKGTVPGDRPGDGPAMVGPPGVASFSGLKDALPRLDFILLGMGEDGHTASLFPLSPAIVERRRWVAVNDGPTVTPPPRVTMTFPLLNAARQVAVLAVGAGKAATLRRVSDQLRSAGPDPQRLPITGIAPLNGRLRWYLDAAAAGLAARPSWPVDDTGDQH
jgi:6-phosphogluconolactonase